MSLVHVTRVLAIEATRLLSGAGGAAPCEQPGSLVEGLLDMAMFAMDCCPHGGPAAVLLCPSLLEAALRLLLAPVRFWIGHNEAQ